VADLKLVIGNKNYSSWSLRPWIAMRNAGIDFDEELVRLNFDQTEDGSSSNKALFDHSPAGKVPVLVHGDVRVWESLAILEYVNELFPDRGLWPAEADARAHARVVACEMHAGFAGLRGEMPMNMRRPPAPIEVSDAARRDVVRVHDIWRDCRARFGAAGPFLFGQFCIADAFYAPVVSRLHVYAVEGDAVVRDYMGAVMALPAFAEWKAAGEAEPWVIEQEER
jgi:glutathione S-transferase